MNIELEFNNRYQKALEATKVDFEVSTAWLGSALKALVFASPVSLGVPAVEFKDLVDTVVKGDTLNCYQFALLSNNLEARTPKDLGYDLSGLDNYLDLMIEYGNNTKAWNDQTKDIRDGILEELSKKVPGKNPLAKA